MHTLENIYFWFRRAQSTARGKPYRMPKDFEAHMREKMSIENTERLEMVTKLFNTKWHNIIPLEYFVCGFELFGENFSYNKFFDRKIIRLYIERDKIKKMETRLTKESFMESVSFVETFMMRRGFNKNLSIVRQYCWLEIDREKTPIKHFQENSIDKYFLTWLIFKRYLAIDDLDRIQIPLVVSNYRQYVSELENLVTPEMTEKIL